MKHLAMKGTALAAALLVGVAACNDGTTGVTGDRATIRVLLTDAPSDYVDSAWVDIGAVELVPADGEDGGIIELTADGTDGYVNLLELQGTATEQLAEHEIDAGTYSQLRLVVDSARVKLIDGYEFNDGGDSRTLFVPSGAQTGIKLNLGVADGDEEDTDGIEIEPGEMVLVLDFDVHQSFVIQGDPETPAGIFGVIFTPTIRAVVNDVAGSIAGTVSAVDDSINVEGLTVTAEPTGDGLLEAYQSETATAQTDENGEYTIHFVVPGDYTVTVEPDSGFVSDPASTDVTVNEDEDVTGIDFELDEESDGS